MSLQCPGCKASIDDDSFYCDQCGAQLMKCGMCGYTGKGKVCPNDRTPLLPAKSLAATRGSTANMAAPVHTPAPAPAPAPAAIVPSPSPSPSPSPVTGSAVPVSIAVPRAMCLRSALHGVELRPSPGDVLGRRFGPHAEVLTRFSQVSSNHLELQRDEGGHWYGKDLNSFNHSFYNGRQLVPGQAQLLESGSTLSLGDVAFTVSFE